MSLAQTSLVKSQNDNFGIHCVEDSCKSSVAKISNSNDIIDKTEGSLTVFEDAKITADKFGKSNDIFSTDAIQIKFSQHEKNNNNYNSMNDSTLNAVREEATVTQMISIEPEVSMESNFLTASQPKLISQTDIESVKAENDQSQKLHCNVYRNSFAENPSMQFISAPTLHHNTSQTFTSAPMHRVRAPILLGSAEELRDVFYTRKTLSKHPVIHSHSEPEINYNNMSSSSSSSTPASAAILSPEQSQITAITSRKAEVAASPTTYTSPSASKYLQYQLCVNQEENTQNKSNSHPHEQMYNEVCVSTWNDNIQSRENDTMTVAPTQANNDLNTDKYYDCIQVTCSSTEPISTSEPTTMSASNNVKSEGQREHIDIGTTEENCRNTADVFSRSDKVDSKDQLTSDINIRTQATLELDRKVEENVKLREQHSENVTVAINNLESVSNTEKNANNKNNLLPPSGGINNNSIECETGHSHTNLFVRNLPHHMDDEELRKLFAPYGQILTSAIMRNIHTGVSLGTAFVRYHTHEEALRAMESFAELKRLANSDNSNSSTTPSHPRQISVQWANRQHDKAPTGEARRRIKKLFIRNIPCDVSQNKLEELFAQFGPIKCVSMHRDTIAKDAVSCDERRIAFVTYVMEGSAEKAAAAVHNTTPFPSCNKIPIMVKLAEDAPVRHAQRVSSHVAASGNQRMMTMMMMTTTPTSSSSLTQSGNEPWDDELTMLQRSGSSNYPCLNNSSDNINNTNYYNNSNSNNSRNFTCATTGHNVHPATFQQNINSPFMLMSVVDNNPNTYNNCSNNNNNSSNIVTEAKPLNDNSSILPNFTPLALSNDLLELVMPMSVNSFSSITTPSMYYPSNRYNSSINDNNKSSNNSNTQNVIEEPPVSSQVFHHAPYNHNNMCHSDLTDVKENACNTKHVVEFDNNNDGTMNNMLNNHGIAIHNRREELFANANSVANSSTNAYLAHSSPNVAQEMVYRTNQCEAESLYTRNLLNYRAPIQQYGMTNPSTTLARTMTEAEARRATTQPLYTPVPFISANCNSIINTNINNNNNAAQSELRSCTMPSILNKAEPAKDNSHNVYVNMVNVQNSTGDVNKLSSSDNNYDMLSKRSELSHSMEKFSKSYTCSNQFCTSVDRNQTGLMLLSEHDAHGLYSTQPVMSKINNNNNIYTNDGNKNFYYDKNNIRSNSNRDVKNHTLPTYPPNLSELVSPLTTFMVNVNERAFPPNYNTDAYTVQHNTTPLPYPASNITLDNNNNKTGSFCKSAGRMNFIGTEGRIHKDNCYVDETRSHNDSFANWTYPLLGNNLTMEPRNNSHASHFDNYNTTNNNSYSYNKNNNNSNSNNNNNNNNSTSTHDKPNSAYFSLLPPSSSSSELSCAMKSNVLTEVRSLENMNPVRGNVNCIDNNKNVMLNAMRNYPEVQFTNNNYQTRQLIPTEQNKLFYVNQNEPRTEVMRQMQEYIDNSLNTASMSTNAEQKYVLQCQEELSSLQGQYRNEQTQSVLPAPLYQINPEGQHQQENQQTQYLQLQPQLQEERQPVIYVLLPANAMNNSNQEQQPELLNLTPEQFNNALSANMINIVQPFDLMNRNVYAPNNVNYNNSNNNNNNNTIIEEQITKQNSTIDYTTTTQRSNLEKEIGALRNRNVIGQQSNVNYFNPSNINKASASEQTLTVAQDNENSNNNYNNNNDYRSKVEEKKENECFTFEPMSPCVITDNTFTSENSKLQKREEKTESDVNAKFDINEYNNSLESEISMSDVISFNLNMNNPTSNDCLDDLILDIERSSMDEIVELNEEEARRVLQIIAYNYNKLI